eukprot:CAMPEP_0170587098 /NCGR_PEP_ID=MMETSP0224-20130122/10102_1 /TAXON_ID=285029 /ORGANISM="Togula jolla, Strain CCCM 725" /LENGTH=90 /DNA_ID=CAMNT_0010910699 /DNA_START=102 /DNA_END=374 /DNA_ORIENTATION=-
MPCHCQYGISGIFLGVIVVVAAAAFWVLGAILDVNEIQWWHMTNLFFFGLGAVLFVLGFIYEFGIKSTPCAREAEADDILDAPTPYIMIA